MVASASAPMLAYSASAMPGVYRTEIRLPNAPGIPSIPWVVSNPIYVGMATPAAAPTSGQPHATRVVSVYADGPAVNWRVERNERSQGSLSVVPSVGGTQISLRYGIGGTVSEGPYVAMAVASGPGLAGADRLTFMGRAVRPMRLSVQLRAPQPTEDKRWSRSVYLDETARIITVFFDELRPAGSATGPPALADVRDILWVVDTVNAQPGSSGQIWLDDVQYVVR